MFIETIINIFSAVKQFILFGIYLSFNIGKLLVSSGVSVLKVVFTLLQNFWTALTILYEEFLFFSNDFRNEIVTVFTTIQNAFNYLYTCVTHAIVYLNLLITILTDFCVNTVNTVYKITIIPKHLLSILYQLLNKFGSGVIFLLTLVPNCIQGGFDLILEIGNSVQEGVLNLTVKVVSTVYNCIFQVSIESILGLVIAILLITLGWKSRFIIHPTILSKLIKTRKYIKMKMTRSKVCTNCVRSTNDEHVDVKKLKAQVHRLEEEKVCVVCQERGRSVLILPCRHFCMCDECAVRIVYGDGMCPVCRAGIRKFIENIFT